MNFFTNFYNKVFSFFRAHETQENDNVKDVARSRLKLVLMQDRTNLTPKILEQMRGELIDLLSKYVELDKELLELNFEQEGDQVALMLSIPVIRAKDEKEIEETLKKEALLKGIQLADDEDDAESEEEAEAEESSSEENSEEGSEEHSDAEEQTSQDSTEEAEDKPNEEPAQEELKEEQTVTE